MKTFLIMLTLFLGLGKLYGQPSSIADSLVYQQRHVFAFKNGELYRAYPIGFRYPRTAAEAGVEGVMSFTAHLTEGCRVEVIYYENSLGETFEESIEKSVARIAYIFRAFEYEKCAEVSIKQTLNFTL